jgi:hypothetical protein
MLLGSATALAASGALAAKGKETHRFRTGDLDIEMSVEFLDGYSSRGFSFRNRTAGRDFCLSASGEQGVDCLTNFKGSLAIAKYRVRSRAATNTALQLRELVRTIDHDVRLAERPPFERVIQLQRGVGSDLQAFGYEEIQGEPAVSESHGPWYLYRQDLFLEPRREPFLVVYWKHALSSIRILDIIPGDQTWVLKK